ncbi:MAG: hypothetical protein RLZZ450_3089 [Pseudomonadota bacterium]|jgi:hypothetical protein
MKQTMKQAKVNRDRRSGRSGQLVERITALIEQRAPVDGITVGSAVGEESVLASAAATNPAAAALAALIELRWRASGSCFSSLRDVVAPFVMGQVASEENEGVRADLAGKLQTQLEKLAAEVVLVGDLPDSGMVDSDEIHRWDSVLVRQLDDIGKEGRKLAKIVRGDSLRRACELRSGDGALAFAGFPCSPAAMWRVWYNTPIPDSYEGARPGPGDTASKRCIYEYVVGRALWLDRVKPELERRRHLEPVRIATNLASTFSRARLMRGEPQDSYIVVQPPSGIALALPLGETLRVQQRGRGLVSLRQVLVGRALRTYLATLLLWQDFGMPEDGVFTFEGANAILDVIGATKNRERKGGRDYERFKSRDRLQVLADLTLFTQIRVRAVGDVEAKTGDALLDELRDRADGRTLAYAHSRLITRELRKSYVRIPRKVCQLDADDVPIAIGVATFARQKMLAHLRLHGAISAPLRALADLVGADAPAGVRKHGRDFWTRMGATLADVAERSEIGTLTIDGTMGPDAVATLSVHEALLSSYSPLLNASKSHERASRHARVADKRKPPG